MKHNEPVGTELSKMIPEWATQFEGKCGCKDFARKMDKWGVAGCNSKRGVIIAHLLAQSEHLIPAFKLIPDAMKKLAAERMLSTAADAMARKSTPSCS